MRSLGVGYNILHGLHKALARCDVDMAMNAGALMRSDAERREN